MISQIAVAALAWSEVAGAAYVAPRATVRLDTRTKLNSRAANIHIFFDEISEAVIDVTYGSCVDRRQSDSHHTVVDRHVPTMDSTQRLVWMIPDDAFSGGCLSAWADDGTLVGRSKPQELAARRSKRDGVQEIHKRSQTKKRDDSGRITMAGAGVDVLGPWFDGVELLKSNNISSVDVAAAKGKKIGIVGGGMSGLMTFLALRQAGFTDLEIIEGGERLGGRVHTVYLSGGPFDYSYQEMGPMRFPYQWVSSTNRTFNISDHQLVFQLAAEMNEINNHAANWSVDFIPWLQSNRNGLYYYDGIRTANGLPPTLGQVSANASLFLQTVQDVSTVSLADKLQSVTTGDDLYEKIATNMFAAHSEFIDNGLNLGLPGDQWSEFAYMVNYLNATLNDTDIVSGRSGGRSLWDAWYEGLYFSAAEWKTIDGGLNRLPAAFHPLVDNFTTMNRKIERVAWDAGTRQVNLQWRNNYTDADFQTSAYDYAVIAVPFSVVRNWRLPGQMDVTMKNAINNLNYQAACKVALEFETRFWEHYENPIYGSCSTKTDIPGIGSICYPSYNINGTGPATMLGSYVSAGGWGTRWAAVSDDEHMQYVLQAMIEIHGDVAREQFTGKYNRRCWALDPLESASWAAPTIGQHELYIPEYFKTHQNMIFVGEHTSYTHAWISSALESGIRGSVQLMLELGLVEEAQNTVEKWMARWIEI